MIPISGHYLRARSEADNRFVFAACLAVLLLAIFVWPNSAVGQTDVRRVGILTYWSIDGNSVWEKYFKVFRRTLADRGWVEGENVLFEVRSARSDPALLAPAAAELVGLNVDVIFAPSAPALRAAYAASRSIPIVTGDYTTDPVADGYAKSYARPGGNVTGVFLDAPVLAGKWFELLQALVPNLSRVAVVWDPGPGTTHLNAVRSVAQDLGITLQILEARKPADIEAVFSALRGRPQGLIILPSPMIYAESPRFAQLALEHRLPATAFAREFADAGGLIAYGPEETSTWGRQANFVVKVLNGNDPGELPVERPSTIQLIVNIRTAKALGMTIPQSILLRADEVIR